MEANPHASRFISSTFPSIWSLELLLQLRQARETAFSAEELVGLLRASEAVVSKSIAALLAAGLILEEEGHRVRYGPASGDLDDEVRQAEELYRAKPDAVRRLIVSGSVGGAAAFADAFRLKGS